MDDSWIAPGVECICVREGPWTEISTTGIFAWLIGVYQERPGPKFMHQYKIVAVDHVSWDAPGHRIRLMFAEYPDQLYCSCGFRPVVGVTDDVIAEQSVTV